MSNLRRKYCGPKLVNKIKELTSDCYNSAVQSVMTELVTARPDLSSTIQVQIEFYIRHWSMYGHLAYSDDIEGLSLREIKQKTDSKYLETLNLLSSKEIEDILWVHEKRRIIRAPRTVESLLAELARRAFLQ